MLALVVGAVVAGIDGSRLKDKNGAAADPQSSSTESGTPSIASSTTTTSAASSSSSSAVPSIQDTWITGDDTKTYKITGFLDYLLFLRNETTGDVGMYEVDTDAFTPEEYQWYIIVAGENSTN